MTNWHRWAVGALLAACSLGLALVAHDREMKLRAMAAECNPKLLDVCFSNAADTGWSAYVDWGKDEAIFAASVDMVVNGEIECTMHSQTFDAIMPAFCEMAAAYESYPICPEGEPCRWANGDYATGANLWGLDDDQ